jgi:DNA repair exonuclease SbcCD ATPase subunit
VKRLVLLAVVVLSACTQHHDELKAIQSTLDLQLARQQAMADNLNELRRELDTLEVQVAQGLNEVPEAEAELRALRAKPLAASPFTTTFPPLPPEGSFEGAEGRQLRMRIADTQMRIVQLGKVIGELKNLDARRERLKQELQIIESKRGAAK